MRQVPCIISICILLCLRVSCACFRTHLRDSRAKDHDRTIGRQETCNSWKHACAFERERSDITLENVKKKTRLWVVHGMMLKKRRGGRSNSAICGPGASNECRLPYLSPRSNAMGLRAWQKAMCGRSQLARNLSRAATFQQGAIALQRVSKDVKGCITEPCTAKKQFRAPLFVVVTEEYVPYF